MVKLFDSNLAHVESDSNGRCNNSSDEFTNLIWTMKAAEYMNEENQENVSRVHVLCCNKCDFLTISLKSLQQHMATLHSIPDDEFNGLDIYSCQECKCVSTERKLIQEHIKIFHNISTENSSNSSLSENIVRKSAILTSSTPRNNRKPSHIKLLKTQLKIRKTVLRRKSLKTRLNQLSINGHKVEASNRNDTATDNRENKKDTMRPTNNKMATSQNIDENDPLDMSMKSTTCQFKGIKSESMDGNDYPYSWKQEPVVTDTCNNMTNNPLLNNPQTCIELIKLTLNQMLNKNTDQNRLPHLGFNAATFLQPQFQLPPNIVPFLLPTNNQNQSQNDLSFITKNPEIEAILATIQQQNLLQSVSPKSFEQNNQMHAYQQSPLYLNHKMNVAQSNLATGLFIDNTQKNGNFSVSPISVFKAKKSTDSQCKTTNKRSLKKQPVPTKIRGVLIDDIEYSQNTKFESSKADNSNNENLFNRSFLDSSEIDVTTDQMELSKLRDDNDNSDLHTNLSNKSSPTTNDKPHRQNFTSQQNRILSDWFFTHCDKPYPSTEDTKELSQLSGLTYSQVKKWFANKRARSSLNKKNHKNYCLINPGESTLEEMGHNELLSISPSSVSEKSYTNHTDPSAAIDFTNYSQEAVPPPQEN